MYKKDLALNYIQKLIYYKNQLTYQFHSHSEERIW